MGAKLIQVSTTDSAYLTLPGSSGEFAEDMSVAQDTIFGSTFQSTQPTLLAWSVNANAVYKGFSGYFAKLLKPGSSTTLTNGPTTLLTTNPGGIYQITNTAQRVLNRAVAVTVNANGVAVASSNIEYIDYLFGKVKFVSGYTPASPVTITGAYFPMVSIGTANKFTLTQTADVIKTTDFATAQSNGGYETCIPGLRTVSLELSGFYNITNGFHSMVTNRTEVVIEVNPDGNSNATSRGFFMPATRSQSGDVGALEEESMQFNLQSPSQALLYIPFNWNYASGTTLPPAIQTVLDSWLNQTTIYVKYLNDGVAGFKGQAIVTDVSLEGSLDGMNIFSAKFQGTGAPTVV